MPGSLADTLNLAGHLEVSPALFDPLYPEAKPTLYSGLWSLGPSPGDSPGFLTRLPSLVQCIVDLLSQILAQCLGSSKGF